MQLAREFALQEPVVVEVHELWGVISSWSLLGAGIQHHTLGQMWGWWVRRLAAKK